MAPADAMSRAEFDALYDELSTAPTAAGGAASASGPGRGALAYLAPDSVAQAAQNVREGLTVSLGLPLATEAGPDVPNPATHRMTQLPTTTDASPVGFAKDYIGVDFHDDGHSHIDALTHVAYRGTLYGGASADSVTAAGATTGTIELLRNGLVGRGVLADVPRSRGVSWLEPGDQVTTDDVETSLHAAGVSPAPGDILFVRTGHSRRLAELTRWDTRHHKAGLHPLVARFLASHRITALGSDSNSDAMPSVVEGIAFPIHVLAIRALGLHLLDYLQFEDLAAVCERLGRWEFLCVVAPLRVDGGTGSPVNPIAIF